MTPQNTRPALKLPIMVSTSSYEIDKAPQLDQPPGITEKTDVASPTPTKNRVIAKSGPGLYYKPGHYEFEDGQAVFRPGHYAYPIVVNPAVSNPAADPHPPRLAMFDSLLVPSLVSVVLGMFLGLYVIPACFGMAFARHMRLQLKQTVTVLVIEQLLKTFGVVLTVGLFVYVEYHGQTKVPLAMAEC